MITIIQLAEWIVKYRRGKAFEGYSLNKICSQLIECANANSMLCVSSDNNIVGVICFRDDKVNRTLYVFDILTTKKGVVKNMMEEFGRRYKGYKIEGKNRNGRFRSFKRTETLTNRL